MSLQNRTLNGFIWNFISAGSKGGITLVLTMVLSRLLPLESFAIIAIIIALTGISTVFIDCGLGQAVIRDTRISEVGLSSVFYFNVLIALSLYVILFAFTPRILFFFKIPADYSLLTRVALLAIIFDACALIQITILTKELNFKPISLATLLSSLIAAIVSFLMALGNGGCWSLVVNFVLCSLLRSCFLWCWGNWMPQLKFEFQEIKRYINFGSYLMLSGIIDHICTSVETLSFGKFFSKSDLAFFSRARDLNSQIVQTFVGIFLKVSYPAFACLQDHDEALKAAYRKTLKVLVFVDVFIVAVLFSCANNLIVVMFGADWAPTALYLRILCLYGIFYPFQVLCCNIFLVKGKSKLYFQLSTFKQVLRIIVLFSCWPLGAVGIALGITLVSILCSFVFIFFSCRLIKYTLQELISDTWISMLIISLASAFATGVDLVIPQRNVLVLLIIQCVVLTLSFWGLCILFKDNAYYLLKSMFLSKIQELCYYLKKTATRNFMV